MTFKLYQRRGQMLQGKSIDMPTKEKIPTNILGDVFDSITKVTSKLSAENYALGRAELINGVLNNAYQQASDNPKQFNELIKSGFEKGLNGLDEKTKKDIYTAANDKVKLLQIKVGNNLNKRLDAENTQKILNLANDTLYGAGGLMDINEQIAASIQTEDSPQKIQKLIEQKNKNIARLKSFANAKNMKGGYVIGSAKMRAAMVNPALGMYDTILNSLEGMDIEALKEYDERTFQNKKGFMEATGLSEKDYGKLDNAIKKQRKSLDEKDKRETRQQSYYNALNYVYTLDPDTLETIKDQIGEENYKSLNELLDLDNRHDFNKALIIPEDANRLGQFNTIVKVLGSKNDGTEEYLDNLLKATVKASRALDDFSIEYGSSKESVLTMKKALVNSAVNQEYADALNMLTDQETALGQEIANYTPERMKQIKSARNLGSVPEPETDLDYIGLKKRGLESRRKEATAIASNTVAKALNQAMTLYDTNDPEQAYIIWEQIKKIREEGNKAIIRNNVSHIIPPNEMERLEKTLNEGKPALFEYNGSVYEFLGFGKNNIFYKEHK